MTERTFAPVGDFLVAEVESPSPEYRAFYVQHPSSGERQQTVFLRKVLKVGRWDSGPYACGCLHAGCAHVKAIEAFLAPSEAA